MMSLKDGPTMLLPMEWRIIEDIIPLLTPFNLMTTELSGGKYPTLDMVIPLVRGVDISLNSKTMETELGVALKILDPRFKKVAFTNIELANKAIQNIKYELAALIGNVYLKTYWLLAIILIFRVSQKSGATLPLITM
ncbi:PREDICTED: zinc finger BED domain-containing protein 1-like isoform X3 [Diuraphis noxia]|uniref:zinc finger BED domain-containing protein 1-like isoform X3 n=1 Tax=Diuraphis noxia TaxID=143948 RepID=UPI000763A701|nr:PREDICTED: zinc finger BED domain-containing protein 1-like isoform X3 [Diuraphis noxia]